MKTMLCRWDEGQTCENAEWVIAWMCDRCDENGVQEICDDHYLKYGENLTGTRYGCGQCGGTISFTSEKLTGEQGMEVIN